MGHENSPLYLNGGVSDRVHRQDAYKDKKNTVPEVKYFYFLLVQIEKYSNMGGVRQGPYEW